MANNRLERVGTIFTRIQGLLRAGAMKPSEKPIWYDVYEQHPPKYQPKFGRPKPNLEIKPIFYAEDVIRAKINKEFPSIVATVNMSDTTRKTNVQKCIDIYNTLKDNHNEEEALKLAVEKVSEEKFVEAKGARTSLSKSPPTRLSESFLKAKEQKVTLQNIFKDEN